MVRCLLFAAGVLLGPSLAWATERLELGPDLCVDRVGRPPPSGIATGALLTDPVVRLCDGTWYVATLRDGRLELAPAAERQPAEVPDSLRLPDGEITVGGSQVAKAWLIGPTEAYRHGILGDRIEASGFRIRLADDTHRELFLGTDSVFEDLRVRLVDLTGDGREEIVAIRSYLHRGAALAVYGLTDGGLVARGESPAIGLAHRWLNPAGAADFDGDGEVEIALVETPHIGGILRVFALREEGLVQEYTAAGFSNHAIGSRTLDLAAVLDWNGDGIADLALPDAGRSTMTVIGFAGGQIVELGSRSHGAEIVTAVHASDIDRDGRPELLYGLSDGTLVLLRP